MDLLSTSAPITARTTATALPSASRPTPERVFDYLLAASIATWAVLGSTTTGPASITRWAISALHFTVALAIAKRGPALYRGTPRMLASAVPALVVAGLALRWAAPMDTWPAPVTLLFVLGASLAIYSFVVLGSSFAVLPARRGIVTHGPYRMVRHPAYAGELVMISACVLSNPSLSTASVLGAALPLIALRIHAEEEILSSSEGYRHYRSRVRNRVIPCLW